MKKGFVEIGIKDKNSGTIFTSKVKEGEEIFYSIVEKHVDTDTTVQAVYAFEDTLELFTMEENSNGEEIHKEFLNRYDMIQMIPTPKKKKNKKNKEKTTSYSHSDTSGYNKEKTKVEEHENR